MIKMLTIRYPGSRGAGVCPDCKSTNFSRAGNELKCKDCGVVYGLFKIEQIELKRSKVSMNCVL